MDDLKTVLLQYLDQIITVVGMLFAFFTASVTPILSDSIKNYFQHRDKIRKLRIALYKEIANNYAVLRTVEYGSNVSPDALSVFVEFAITTDVYQSAIQKVV